MYSDHDRKLLSLPARFGGFGIQIKKKEEEDTEMLELNCKTEW